MKKRFVLAVICGTAAVVYACGGAGTTNLIDSGSDGTTGNDGGGNDGGSNDTGTTGDSAGGPCDGGCTDFITSSCDGGCPNNSVCVSKTQGPTTVSRCYPLPACGCNGKSDCECVGTCACGSGVGQSCQNTSNGIFCQGGTVSRREYKTDIDYLSDSERASLADQALRTRLAEYRYKTEAETTQRHLGFIIDDMPAQSPAVESDKTHVDLYGYTSMLLATVQEQQKQIDALKKQVDALQKSAKTPRPHE